MRKRRLILAFSILHACGVHAQSIEFPNAQPGMSVALTAGTPVSIDINGNFRAQCDTQSASGCALVGGGGPSGCSGPPTVSQALSVSNPTSPGAPGPYAGGTTLTMAATLPGAVVCSPTATVNGSGTAIFGWSGPIVPAAGGVITQAVTLPAITNATVVLRLTCFGAGGSASTQRTVNTSGAGGGGPGGCPSQIPYTSTNAGSTTTTPLGGISMWNINGFEQLINVLGFNTNPFPSTGTTGLMLAPSVVARSIRFTVPNPFPIGAFSRRFGFGAWPNGFIGSNGAYISVSTCPGDFRVPTATQSGVLGDPTYAEACRNWRGNLWTLPGNDEGAGDIPYVVGTVGQPNLSTPSQCILVPGQTYYLNLLMSRPNRAMRSLFPLDFICFGFANEPFDCGHGVFAGG